MSRPTLIIARKPKPGPTYALVRKAARLFRSDLVPRSVRHANIRKWLKATEQLGDKHLYRGGIARWGTQTKGIRK